MSNLLRLLPGVLFAVLLCAPTTRGDDTKPAAAHWSFQPVHRPALPAVRDRGWPRTPVDAFVLARLEKAGLRPNLPADPRTLLRRVHLDLTGLPPTPAVQRAFLADPSPAAYARVVENLLARPAYGERWARHWLDVARYADTNGYERDGDKPNAWRYRDWVIDAFNADLPYDRFVLHQLAGDEVRDADAASKIATTFLRLGTWDDEPADDAIDRYDQLDDVLGVTASTFLGLTLRCARCHDHKFEPFTIADYYRLLAVVTPLKRPQLGRADLDRLVGGLFTRAYIWYEDGPKAPQTHILKRGDPERPGKLVEPGLPGVLAPTPLPPPQPLARSTGRRLWLARWIASAGNPLTARVMVNRLWQYHFGRGIVGTTNDFGLAGERPTHPELLDWLAAELTERGWSLKHLHRLIVLSAAYQTSCAPGAGEQHLERRLALFGRWRQRRVEAEVLRDSVLAVSGRLLRQARGPGVYPPLAKNVLRTQSRAGLGWGRSDERQSSRRSVYVFAKRSLVPPELELFDTPDTTSSCERRPVSITGPQALTLLNGTFYNEQAAHFAERLLREAGSEAAAQVRRAYALALCRPPSPEEEKLVLAFLARQRRQIEAEQKAAGQPASDAVQRALAAFCLVLFNSNEFVYPG
jgi:hypothetical protein